MGYLELAAPLAERGWAVHPLRSGTKRPALHGDTKERPCPRTGICADKHQGWEQRATADRTKLDWFGSSRKFADCNVGVACGPSGLLVVDLDVPKPDKPIPERWNRRGITSGLATLALLCDADGHDFDALWNTYTVKTARSGWHLYYRMPKGVSLRNTSSDHGSGLGPLIDTRGHGGYVVGPGSSTPDGHYEVTNDAPLMELPGWLVQALTPKPLPAVSAPTVVARARLDRYVDAAIEGERERVLTAASGEHDKVLWCAAIALGQLVGGGSLPPATAEAELLSAAAQSMYGTGCDCTEARCRRTIERGIAAGAARRPRTVATDQPAPAAPALFDQTRGAA